MKIHPSIKKCVAFIQCKMHDGTFRSIGTVFFIARDNNPLIPKYAVTAKHVIEGITNRGLDEIYIRLNLRDSTTTTIQTNTKDWIVHEYDDIAIYPLGLSDNIDHMFYPESEFLNDEKILINEIDCGDEVFIMGLFVHHHGIKSNLPIVRVGTIAMMPGEKVQTVDLYIDAYLIESRSIGGLSGSPVYINYGLIRKLDGVIKHRNGEDIHHLLGLVRGHYDSRLNSIDHINSGSSQNDRMNIGIAIVTPISKLSELFESEKVRAIESKISNP